MVDALSETVTPEQAVYIVDNLADLFKQPAPTIIFDTNMSDPYIAYCWPQPERYEIHFRQDYIPWNTPFHEFTHILFTNYTGSIDKVRSEAFAQYMASMSLVNGKDLLNFRCPVCGQRNLTLLNNGELECNVDHSAYAMDLYSS